VTRNPSRTKLKLPETSSRTTRCPIAKTNKE
jgi:hypothetical protein